ncbi:MAG: transglutaminase domain-containing protein [Bacteroidales bacterium]
MRHLTLTFAILLCILSSCKENDWQSETKKLMAQGEFNAAETMFNSLPEDVRNESYTTIDSFLTIMSRIRLDFKVTPEDGKAGIRERLPEATDEEFETWKDKKYIETLTIDGVECWFRKSVSNFWLLNSELPDSVRKLNNSPSTVIAQRPGKASELIAMERDANNVADWRRNTMKFTIDINANAVAEGEIIRAWLPIALENQRQNDVIFISSSDPATISKNSPHHTVYMEKAAVKDSVTHFEIVFAYSVAGQYWPQNELEARIQPYNTESDEYKTYTSAVDPHIVVDDKMRELAQSIIGDETEPLKQASLIYDWIDANFPWAGAREYSTIACMPQYVLDIKHGDCGQVSLLYISMLRSIGIPARWESGWVVRADGSTGYHDWSETYFEGIGWIPCDMSYGLLNNEDSAVRNFYKSSLDNYRMTSNSDIASPLEPAKKFIRSETVDFQSGEVETAQGNLYYTDWKCKLELIHTEEIK